ncbi:MAG: CHRD domain-containing protein [Leptolyngbyaceae cyanobacterium SL_7_1]|nr:CHRD domain-containing protein [Leptolyngbyaceae cyanobacterium SL_7_1]
MNNIRKRLLNCFLGVVACLVLVGIAQASPLAQPTEIAPQIAANLREADAVLLAQSNAPETVSRYVAVLTKNNVVPATPTTAAFGSAGAVLMGDRLIVRGDFSNLTSPLRDYATDPLDPPNPNITSGVHIHQGEATTNGPFQYALEVTPGDTELKGRFAGSYTLTSEQLQALSTGNLYVDLHTRRNRAGELRGVFQPY